MDTHTVTDATDHSIHKLATAGVGMTVNRDESCAKYIH